MDGSESVRTAAIDREDILPFTADEDFEAIYLWYGMNLSQKI